MKLILIVQNGSLAGRRFDFTDGMMTVGRGVGCNLMFDPMQENMVSSKHAHFEVKTDGFYLFDDRSTNGTFINGNHIQVAKLNNGDTIQFGKNGPLVSVTVEAATIQPQSLDQLPTIPVENFNAGGGFVEQFQPPPPNFNQPFQTPQFVQPPPPPQFDQSFQQPQFEQPSFIQPNFRNSMNYIGLGNPEVKIEDDNKTGKIIGAIVALGIYGILGLVTIWIVYQNLGLLGGIIATVIAFIPATIYILPLIFLDRYDPEPPWLIAGAFAWGGLAAIVFSYYVNTFVRDVTLEATQDQFSAFIASAVLSAPIFEELSKGVGVVILLIFFRREFDDVLDGIVYGGVIGLGFATVENILYYGGGLLTGNIVFLFLLRGIFSPFIHSTFTAMTGIGCGISRESHNWVVRIIAPIGGYILAVLLHMLWNGLVATVAVGIISSILGPVLGSIVAIVALGFPPFLIFVGVCGWIMRRQNKILRESLAIDVAQGVLSDEQFKTATSAFKSTGWLLGGIFAGKFFARWKFLRAVGKLGLTYWHIQRATAAQGHTGSFKTNPILRQQVINLREKV